MGETFIQTGTKETPFPVGENPLGEKEYKQWHERYSKSYLGGLEVPLLLNTPNSKVKQWEVIYEYQDLGTIEIEEKVWGKKYYENLIINKLQIMGSDEALQGVRGSLGLLLTQKSDGRTDIFTMCRIKGFIKIIPGDTTFTDRF